MALGNDLTVTRALAAFLEKPIGLCGHPHMRSIHWVGPFKSQIDQIANMIPQRHACAPRRVGVVGAQLPIRFPHGARHQDVHLEASGVRVRSHQGLQSSNRRNAGICSLEKQAQGLADLLPQVRIPCIEGRDRDIVFSKGQGCYAIDVGVTQRPQSGARNARVAHQQLRCRITQDVLTCCADRLTDLGAHQISDDILWRGLDAGARML